MKLHKYALITVIICVAALVQSTFHFNEYILLILVGASFVCMWEILEHKDVSMRKREKNELQEEVKSTAKDAHLKNKQLLTVVTSIPFPMMLVDQFGNIVMHNNLEEISNTNVSYEMITYLKNNYAYPAREFIKDAFILEKSMDRIIKIDGIEYQAISVPVTAKRKYSGCLVLFQDISKTLEGEKMQKRFIADASHELKTPIAVIKGMVEILNRDDFDDQVTQREFLEQIEMEINRLDMLVKDLLQLSRLSMSNVLLKREKTDVTVVIDTCVKSLHKKAEKKGIAIVCEYESHDHVFCDPNRMDQVIINLLGNAIDYSDGGTITLRTKKEGIYYVIEVRDEGHGISIKDQEKIFERFYRVDNDRSRQSGGSGLGLAIVKSIIEAHGGKIEVESELDQGTTFRILLKN